MALNPQIVSRTISLTNGEHRVSPPRTPPVTALDAAKNNRQASASPSDDSSIIELSFDYELDSAGNYVRISKGSSRSNQSSPPTPHEILLDGPLAHKPSSSPPGTSAHIPPHTAKPPSPVPLNSPDHPRRNSLTLSESYLAQNSVLPELLHHRHQSLTTANSARSFQRATSVPAALTPAAQSALRAPLSNGLRGTSRKIGLPQRVPLDEHRDSQQADEREDIMLRARGDWDIHIQEDKENLMTSSDGTDGMSSDAGPARQTSPRLVSRSASLSQVEGRAISGLPTRAYVSSMSGGLSRPPLRPGRQILPGPNRAGRVLMGSKYGAGAGGFDRINEYEGSESEVANDYPGSETDTGGEEPHTASGQSRRHNYAPPIVQPSSTRPRRSASLSDASGAEDRRSPGARPTSQNQYSSRPGSSLGLNSAHALRTPMEQESYAEYPRRQIADVSPDVQQSRHSPSPTHMSQAHLRSHVHKHSRRDSDTVRTLGLDPAPGGSPTAVEHLPTRLSPKGRPLSSTIQQQPFPIIQVQPSQPQSQLQGQVYHRRSPTAPEPPTTSGTLVPSPGTGIQKNGKTWAAGEEPVENESEVKATQRERMRPAPPPPPPTAPPSLVRNHNIVVNRKVYARLDLLGKGGSSRVYRVMNAANEIYAIKRVSLDKADAETISGYMNEIGLLKRLEGNNRIIHLFDSEVKAGPGGGKGHLMLVMECGEIDLAKLLQEQQREPLNMVWISYYWQQMLQAVHVIHEEKIVHSDLKPANFVLVRGQLKLIDFGIANAIANDTTNIQRDHQIGTVNYMSPEAIELPEGMRRLKVGRPSDVWSLGCILYQMVYGQPPFQHLSVYQKMKAIPDLAHEIEFPEFSIPSVVNKNGERKKLDHLKKPVRADVIRGMRSCLARHPKERATIPELLEQEWLTMREPEAPQAKSLLASDETIINPYYMKQLLEYGIKLGQQAQAGSIDPAHLAKEAERLVAELKALES
ncbi:kinase-like domain-containing protein [Chiua virens]|nr:kinase-like domain-containing protein [Chiua virens]